MELVKRLEGSAPEVIEYDFERHYLEEDKETSKRKKGTLFTIIGLIFIAVIGYFGFKYFKGKEVQIAANTKVASLLPKSIQTAETPPPVIKDKVETTEEINKKNQKIEDKKSDFRKELDIVLTVVKNKKVEKKVEEVSIYTEVLAQRIKPKLTQTEVLAQKIKPKLTQAVVSQPVLKEIKIVKKPIPKKKVIKHIVTKKAKYITTSGKQRIAIVKKGDTLALISKRFYGSTKEFERIVRANRNIRSHKTSLKIGQKIVVPYLNTKQSKSVNSVKSSPKKTRVITVKKGDTLNVIAQRVYGSAKEYKRIIRANKNIRSSKTRLKLGQKVIVPYMPKNKRRRFVTVKKGYSLAYISKKFYGNISEVKRIVSANYNIKSAKSTLRIGQKVYVPR